MIGGMNGMQRIDPSKIVDNLFSKLDTKGQGYIEKSDLQGAFDQASSKTPSVDDIFKALDGDGDGKVTKQEMSDSVQKLADQLVGQLQSMRMGGMSKSDVSGMAESVTGSAAQKLTDLAENFDAADTNQDGNVSAQELMAYRASNGTSSSSSDVQSSEARVMARIMDLMATYGAFNQDEQTRGSAISTAV